jgi:hypothetical protein
MFDFMLYVILPLTNIVEANVKVGFSALCSYGMVLATTVVASDTLQEQGSESRRCS